MIDQRSHFSCWRSPFEAGDQSNPDFENPEVVVRFAGRDVDLLLSQSRRAAPLALEHVTQEALRIHFGRSSRISFDANDYRTLRIEELRMSALAAAEKVKQTGQPFHFNPMNSRERRVIHIALRNETELRSESLGLGPSRHVIVYPASMASFPSRPPRHAPPQDRYRRDDRGPHAVDRAVGARGWTRAAKPRWDRGDRRGGPRGRVTQVKLQDTIAAISTPPGRGGIGVVRLSGPSARISHCDRHAEVGASTPPATLARTPRRRKPHHRPGRGHVVRRAPVLHAR